MKFADHEALTASVAELLGFSVTERENDAVVVGPSKSPEGKTIPRWVRPATQQEVIMYLRVMGLVARIGELTTGLDAGVVMIAKQAKQLTDLKMGHESFARQVKSLGDAIVAERDAEILAIQAELADTNQACSEISSTLGDAEQTIAELRTDLSEYKAEAKRYKEMLKSEGYEV